MSHRAAPLGLIVEYMTFEFRTILPGNSRQDLVFKQWDTVFPNASCAVALIDRLTHHAEIIPIEGESYRKREAELTQKKRRAAP